MLRNFKKITFLVLFGLLGCDSNTPKETTPSKGKNLNVHHTNVKEKESGYVAVKGGRLFYKTFGSGEPIIVLHGGPGLDQTYLLPQMLELSKKYRVIFYDQRGCGKSDQTPMDLKHINLDQYVQDLQTLQKHLKLKKVILMGHSWGGYLALSYALKHPSSITSLVLATTAPVTPKGTLSFMANYAQRTAHVHTEVQKVFSYDQLKKLTLTDIVKCYRTLYACYMKDPKNADLLTIDVTQDSAKRGFKVMELMTKNGWLNTKINLLPLLKSLHIPTLVVHGNNDLIPLEASLEIKETIPGAKMIRISDCGHFPYVEQPKVFFDEVFSFLENTKNAS